MKKKFFTLFVIIVVAVLALSACAPNKPPEEQTAVLLMPVYAEYFKFIADTAAASLEELGVTVEILSADLDPQTMINQTQNAIVQGVDILYIFPVGDASSFHDVVQEAHDAGIKVIVSHNTTGEGTADSIILADEFIMGTMGSAMVNEWVEKTYPDAAPGTVKVLVLEAAFIPDTIKRSTALKLVAEKFLRKVDMTTGTFVKTESSETVYYVDGGQEFEVDESTGGLILDAEGHAILNPHYNEKVNLIEISNRNVFSNIDAQNAMDTVFTADGGANSDIVAVITYGGDAAIGASEKFISLYETGVITTDLSMVGAFGADDTQTNIDYLLNAQDSNVSVLRGVTTAGDIIGTIANTLAAMAKGESVPEFQWEPLGFMTANEDYTDVVRIYYENELPPTEAFFDN